jgi:hypothetical protein
MVQTSLYFNSLFDFLSLVVRVVFFFDFGGVLMALMGWETGRKLGQRVYRVGARRAVL